jgi:hypothetical protein
MQMKAFWDVAAWIGAHRFGVRASDRDRRRDFPAFAITQPAVPPNFQQHLQTR